MDFVIFSICAIAVIGGALGVVTGRNPVHCALFLLVSMVGIAVLFLLQGAALVAIIQIVVYASAIVVLFLFVITLLGVDRHETREDPRRFQRPAAVMTGVLVFLGIVFITRDNWVTGKRSSLLPLENGRDGYVRTVARTLFTDYVWAFEITAVLLVIAVVGGVVLARRSSRRVLDPGAVS